MRKFYARSTTMMSLAIAVYLLTPALPARSDDVGASNHVPLLDDGPTIRVPVRMFDETLYFIVDTGSAVSLLDATYRNKLGSSVRDFSVGTGISSANPIAVYRCPDFYVGGSHGHLEEIGCENLKTFQYVTGVQCDGVLGMDFLHAYAVTIDFDNRTLSLSDRVSDSDKNHAEAVPLLDVSKNIVGVQSTLNSIHRAKVIIDTGDSRSISLNRHDWDDALPEASGAKLHNVLVVALHSKPTQILSARLDQLEVGSQKYKNLLCFLLPNSKQPSGLGLRFLRQHFAILDFPRHVVYLRQREHYDAPDDPDMSGLHLMRRDGATSVYAVDDQSPAVIAGIKAGDVIRSVNGTDVDRMTMEEVRHSFQSADGASVHGVAERDGQVQTFELILKKPL